MNLLTNIFFTNSICPKRILKNVIFFLYVIVIATLINATAFYMKENICTSGKRMNLVLRAHVNVCTSDKNETFKCVNLVLTCY